MTFIDQTGDSQTRMTVEAGNPKTDPSMQSRDYIAMRDYWRKVETIIGGADAMHAAGEVYLPRFQEERVIKDTRGASFDPYKIRLQKAPFTNIFEDITRNLASKPFAKELTLKEDTPDSYKELADNIDGQGRSLHVFGQEVFKAAVQYGITWILVDFTRAIPRADGMPLTKADEAAQKLRPYWVHIMAPRMLAVYSDFESGVEIITHARIYEPGIALDGFHEMPVERVRVLDRLPLAYDDAGKPVAWGPPTYRVWELVTGPVSAQTGKVSTWVVVEEGVFAGMSKIPLIPFYTGDRVQGSFVIHPPMQGLANMQIDEYNLESGLQNTMDMTCFPMLAANGVAPPASGEPTIAIGPRNIVWAPPLAAGGRPGSFNWIEPGASSIKVVMERLENCRTEMRDLGMQPLTQSNLTVITTGAVAVKANSAVQAWTIRFADALEQCWQLTAQWMGDTFEPEVVVYKDFNLGMDNGVGFNAVMALRTNKDISAEAAINAAVRYGYLPDDFDLQADAKLLAEEQQGLAAEQPINPLTGQPIAALQRLQPAQTPPKRPAPQVPPTVQ